MRHWLPIVCAALIWAGPLPAQGVLVPRDGSIPPLALVTHQVDVNIVEQVAVTKVTQVFRNSSDRALEADYVFPVPKGASVDKFSMWVNGKEVKGELVEADKARQVYTDIVRRMQDPGLLEYIGSNLLKVRVYPVPARGEQKLTLSYTSISEQEGGLVEYVYPLKNNEKTAQALEKFSLNVTMKSKHSLQNVYSPTHPVTVKHHNDREVCVAFEKEKAALDKNFELYYSLSSKDVGLSALTHRPEADIDGHVMLLLSPRAELSRSQQIARDMVFVLDTSGSMAGPKMDQARKALKFCLSRLTDKDRFAVLNFASTVNKYADNLHDVSKGEVDKAKKWVDALEATGGTAIDAALNAALDYRSSDEGRTFTVVFFTDGMPTVGETNPDNIIKMVTARNSSCTRIFTFGVGDDVNAAMLDKLADQTRAVSTYVRPEEDIEVKVSGLYAKISHPVLSDLKLKTGENVQLTEMYPQHLPDLFHGGQLVVMARYKGKGHATVTLTGKVGNQTKEFVYEVDFSAKTGNDKAFVECLWARRKVGYLLDQIRNNGEQKELVDEVVKLAKKHGITTPYTSYLVVPDGVQQTPVVQTTPASGVSGPDVYQSALTSGVPVNPNGQPGFSFNNSSLPQSYTYGMGGPSAAPMAAPGRVMPSMLSSPAPSLANAVGGQITPGATPPSTFHPDPKVPMGVPVMEAARAPVPPKSSKGMRMTSGMWLMDAEEEEETEHTMTEARQALGNGQVGGAQTGKLGVDLALQLNALRNQEQVSKSKTCQAAGRTCVSIQGVWCDQGFTPDMKMLNVKMMSDAYFKLLEKHPELKEVFKMGSRIIWVTPCGTALILSEEGEEKLSDDAMEKLFVVKK